MVVKDEQTHSMGQVLCFTFSNVLLISVDQRLGDYHCYGHRKQCSKQDEIKIIWASSPVLQFFGPQYASCIEDHWEDV